MKDKSRYARKVKGPGPRVIWEMGDGDVQVYKWAELGDGNWSKTWVGRFVALS